MKGIILAAGKGTRLYPITLPMCKALLPIYDKPLIYYSIATLLEAEIEDILVIIPPGYKNVFERLLGDGSDIGVHITYGVQTVARGIADAFIVGEKFIGTEDVCLVLGDNIFYSDDFESQILAARKNNCGATVFGYWVEDPRPFGVIEFNAENDVISIEEKPENPKSNYIVPGLYFYDNDVLKIVKTLKPSQRGELEITDINVKYIDNQKLKVKLLGKEAIWFDAGTADSLFDAGRAVKEIQKLGRNIGCIEEIAWKKGLITDVQLLKLAEKFRHTQYGKYLHNLLD